MAVNMEAAQLVVGAAILDEKYCRELLRDRGKALKNAERHPCAPSGAHLTGQDRLTLGAIRARTLHEFAIGVERARSVVRQDQPHVEREEFAG